MSSEITRPQIEEALPGFEILDEIARGNIKQVYNAEVNGTLVCLKLIPFEPGSRLEGYTRREAEIMEQTESEHFVNLIVGKEVSIAGSQAMVFVEEHYGGGTLEDKISNRNTGYRLGIRVANAILAILSEFEASDIVHRDIKPGNVMFTEEGEVRLIDAGVARMNQKDTLTPDFRQSGPGTPAYSAPEVLQNEKKKEDTRSDLFSTGIVFFEAVTGNHPFRSTGQEISDSILEHNRDELQGFLDDEELEDQLNEFYLRLTEYEPMDRYRRPDHARGHLVEIMNDQHA